MRVQLLLPLHFRGKNEDEDEDEDEEDDDGENFRQRCLFFAHTL